MSITITWLPHTLVSGEVLNIYRSDTRNGTFALLDSFNTSINSYTDTTALDNKVYFYKVTNTVNGSTGTSVIIPFANFPNTGPGPTTLLRGDWEFGYFGELGNSLLPTFTEILTAAGLTMPTWATGNLKGAETIWRKWIVNGRIIYFPEQYLCAGQVLGGNGKLLVAANQDRIVNGAKLTKNGNNLLARYMYATNKFTTAVNPDNEFVAGIDNVISAVDPSFSKSEVAAFLFSRNISFSQNNLLPVPNFCSDGPMYGVQSSGWPTVTSTYTSTGVVLAFPSAYIVNGGFTRITASPQASTLYMAVLELLL